MSCAAVPVDGFIADDHDRIGSLLTGLAAATSAGHYRVVTTNY